jgi:alkylation response protein AidB-like acyl-CoA dehydrogenase
MLPELVEESREESLRRLLGDPWDADNPVNFAAVLAADETRLPFAAAEGMLDGYGLNAEFVPRSLGGRLGGVDHMIRMMRVVCRRDLALVFGYCGSSFIGSQNVWSAGDRSQQAGVARRLLAGARMAAAYHELDHGNDFLRAELEARATADGLSLTGRKEVISNANRVGQVVVFARTAAGSGPWSHSQILVDLDAVPADRFRRLPRFHSVGMHGVHLGGIEFLDCPVPAGSVLGRRGQGLATAMRSFQVTRTALPAIALASLDTCLRVVLDFAQGRQLSGRPVSAFPAVSRILSEAFVDLLICDAISMFAARALHLRPAETSVYSAAAKYLVPRWTARAVHRLSSVLGAGFYVRDGRHGVFQKHLRDLAPAVFGHIAPNASLATLLSQLPALARRPWTSDELPEDALFRLSDDLPDLRFERLAVSAGRGVALVDSIPAAVAEIAAGGSPALTRLTDRLVAETGALRDACRGIDPNGLGPAADTAAFDLAARYVRLVAAAACLHAYRVRRGQGFLGDPAWPAAALRRLFGEDADSGEMGRAWAELTSRYGRGETFDLAAAAG